MIIGVASRLPGLEPDSAIHRLCDLGQVTSLLCALVLLSVKWV